MNRPKKNSIRAQASSDLNTEAALKFIPLNSFKKDDEDEIETDEKDPTEGPPEVLGFDVTVALNGYYVSFSYADPDMPDARHVVHTIDEVVELIRSNF